jgi:hypothetical protein
VSDTPRTESFNCYDNGCDNPLHAWGAFSAELERELNAANDRIKRLEEDLMDAKNKHAALVADVALYEDRGERIKRLEDIISRASSRFFRDGSNGMVAIGMLNILEEVRKL